MLPTQRSANAFAFEARNGVRMISTPSLRKTSSKARLNLLSRSCDHVEHDAVTGQSLAAIPVAPSSSHHSRTVRANSFGSLFIGK